MALRRLDSIEAKELKDLLLDRRKVLEFDLAGLENETTGEGAERAGAQSSAPGHLAELASDASEKAVMFGQMESQSDELTQVRDALERLDTGSFGLCDDCNMEIPIERLRAIPYALLCRECKSAEERGEADPGITPAESRRSVPLRLPEGVPAGLSSVIPPA